MRFHVSELLGRCWREFGRQFESAWWRLGVAVVACGVALPASADDALYTFGPDAFGTGRVFTEIGPGGGTVPLGDGSVAFNGGLAYSASNTSFYAIQNDSFGGSSLVSFSASNPAALSSPLSLGTGFFLGGLALDSAGALYSISTDFLGASTLYSIDKATGATTQVGAGPIGVFMLGGLAFDSTDGDLYSIGLDEFGVSRRVSEIDLATGVATTLFDLGDGSTSFQGGLTYDAALDRFVVIGNDMFGNSSLYAFTATTAALTSLGSPIGVGFLNAGLAYAPAGAGGGGTVSPIPEPASVLLMLFGLGFLALQLRRSNSPLFLNLGGIRG